ncbi:hypothetical protein [Paraoerskovia sediminicola]|uniref:hypothetical protein n=1 Tax=Paraoerskovia sediminicola TaxID=1138587 RepID=UPI002572D5D7|nr:hypothetical protein [Paraoerskovia sediminicola]
MLGILLALALGAAAYLWLTTTRWQESSSEWESNARELGDEVASLTAELGATAADLETAKTQLDAAQTRIDELANEKAQLGDDQAVSDQYLDYQQRVSEAAGTVALSLDRCIDGQAQLIEYLRDADSYDPDELSRFASDVDDLCSSAKDANTRLQSALDG